MNSFSTATESLKPLYMSQTEANAVMELWARRQQEEAARQSMVTVHDVAEATQLSQSEVEKLLTEIRSQESEVAYQTRRVQPTQRNVAKGIEQISALSAYRRLSPYLGVCSAIVSLFIWTQAENWQSDVKNFMYDPKVGYYDPDQHFFMLRDFSVILGLYAFLTLMPVVSRYLLNGIVQLCDLVSVRLKSKSSYGKR